MNIRLFNKNGQSYYQLYDGNKFIQHIGNAEALKVFKRNNKNGITHLEGDCL